MRNKLLLSALVLLAACAGVKDDPLPQDMSDPAMKEIADALSDDDKRLLAGYLMRREMGKVLGGQNIPDDAKTVGEAIEAQEKWAETLSENERKAAELKAEIEAKRKAFADTISKDVTVAFIDAEFLPSSYQSGRYDDYETFTFAVKNNGAKALKALKGDAVFIDTFGDEFVRMPMQFEELIKSGENKNVELGKEINKFMDSDKRIMQLDGSKKFHFEPKQIVYEDGTSLKAPDQSE